MNETELNCLKLSGGSLKHFTRKTIYTLRFQPMHKWKYAKLSEFCLVV